MRAPRCSTDLRTEENAGHAGQKRILDNGARRATVIAPFVGVGTKHPGLEAAVVGQRDFIGDKADHRRR
jgi:hypothetical protein